MIRPLGVVIGAESKIDYLSRVNSSIPATSFIQKHLAPEEKTLFMWGGEGYYCDERCLPDAEQSRWTLLAQTSAFDAATISARLHESGITHLLYSKESLEFILQHDPTGENSKAASYFLNDFKDRCAELVYSDPANILYKLNCQVASR
jgi:hypothetical protein